VSFKIKTLVIHTLEVLSLQIKDDLDKKGGLQLTFEPSFPDDVVGDPYVFCYILQQIIRKIFVFSRKKK
jgi:hypothetical protein